jgi:transketolase
VIGVDRFSALAQEEVVMREYGLNVENVCERALDLVKQKREMK